MSDRVAGLFSGEPPRRPPNLDWVKAILILSLVLAAMNAPFGTGSLGLLLSLGCWWATGNMWDAFLRGELLLTHPGALKRLRVQAAGVCGICVLTLVIQLVLLTT